jgi:hypothetical protein
MFALLCWWGGLQPAGFHAQLPSLFLLTHRENSALLATEHWSFSPHKERSLISWPGNIVPTHTRERTLFSWDGTIFPSHKGHCSFWQSTRYVHAEYTIYSHRINGSP